MYAKVSSSESNSPIGASYARFSSDLQRDTSVDDQQRVCRERATQDGVVIATSLEFVDRAVSGATVARTGLDELRAAAAAGQFAVLYVYSLSRLSRESTHTLAFLKELVFTWKVRLVSITDGIDSTRENWYDFSVLLGLQNERYLKELSLQVKRGQEGTVLSGFSAGDTCYGYRSIPSPDGATVGRGRNAKPRKIYSIDQEAAAWVLQVFRWFADDKQSIAWIVRELNRRQVAKCERASTSRWYHDLVVRILSSEKYIGRWPWRSTARERDWQTGRVKQVPVPEHARTQFIRDLPHLRVIDDETFYRAQSRLSASRDMFRPHRLSGGRLAGSPSRCRRRFLLDGKLRCQMCGRRYVVVGNNKQYYGCVGHQRGYCECATRLPRATAEERVFQVVAGRLIDDPRWRAAVYEEVLREWQKLSLCRPDELSVLQKKRSELEQGVQRLISSIETANSPPAAILQRIDERQTEIKQIEAKIRSLQAAPPIPSTAPTPEFVDLQLAGLLDALREGTPAAIEAFQNLIHGPIDLEEVPVPARKRKSLRAILKMCPTAVGASILGQPTDLEPSSDDTELILIDFRKTTATEDQARRALALWDAGQSCAQIAEALGVSRSRVTAIFQFAHDTLGIPYPETRRRRPVGALAKRIEADVIARWEAGVLLAQIAEELNVSSPTIHKVLKRYHDLRGEVMPDGRSRRKALAMKGRERPGGVV